MSSPRGQDIRQTASIGDASARARALLGSMKEQRESFESRIRRRIEGPVINETESASKGESVVIKSAHVMTEQLAVRLKERKNMLSRMSSINKEENKYRTSKSVGTTSTQESTEDAVPPSLPSIPSMVHASVPRPPTMIEIHSSLRDPRRTGNLPCNSPSSSLTAASSLEDSITVDEESPSGMEREPLSANDGLTGESTFNTQELTTSIGQYSKLFSQEPPQNVKTLTIISETGVSLDSETQSKLEIHTAPSHCTESFSNENSSLAIEEVSWEIKPMDTKKTEGNSGSRLNGVSSTSSLVRGFASDVSLQEHEQDDLYYSETDENDSCTDRPLHEHLRMESIISTDEPGCCSCENGESKSLDQRLPQHVLAVLPIIVKTPSKQVKESSQARYGIMGQHDAESLQVSAVTPSNSSSSTADPEVTSKSDGKLAMGKLDEKLYSTQRHEQDDLCFSEMKENDSPKDLPLHETSSIAVTDELDCGSCDKGEHNILEQRLPQHALAVLPMDASHVRKPPPDVERASQARCNMKYQNDAKSGQVSSATVLVSTSSEVNLGPTSTSDESLTLGKLDENFISTKKDEQSDLCVSEMDKNGSCTDRPLHENAKTENISMTDKLDCCSSVNGESKLLKEVLPQHAAFLSIDTSHLRKTQQRGKRSSQARWDMKSQHHAKGLRVSSATLLTSTSSTVNHVSTSTSDEILAMEKLDEELLSSQKHEEDDLCYSETDEDHSSTERPLHENSVTENNAGTDKLGCCSGGDSGECKIIDKGRPKYVLANASHVKKLPSQMKCSSQARCDIKDQNDSESLPLPFSKLLQSTSPEVHPVSTSTSDTSFLMGIFDGKLRSVQKHEQADLGCSERDENRICTDRPPHDNSKMESFADTEVGCSWGNGESKILDRGRPQHALAVLPTNASNFRTTPRQMKRPFRARCDMKDQDGAESLIVASATLLESTSYKYDPVAASKSDEILIMGKLEEKLPASHKHEGDELGYSKMDENDICTDRRLHEKTENSVATDGFCDTGNSKIIDKSCPQHASAMLPSNATHVGKPPRPVQRSSQARRDMKHQQDVPCDADSLRVSNANLLELTSSEVDPVSTSTAYENSAAGKFNEKTTCEIIGSSCLKPPHVLDQTELEKLERHGVKICPLGSKPTKYFKPIPMRIGDPCPRSPISCETTSNGATIASQSDAPLHFVPISPSSSFEGTEKPKMPHAPLLREDLEIPRELVSITRCASLESVDTGPSKLGTMESRAEYIEKLYSPPIRKPGSRPEDKFERQLLKASKELREKFRAMEVSNRSIASMESNDSRDKRRRTLNTLLRPDGTPRNHQSRHRVETMLASPITVAEASILIIGSDDSSTDFTTDSNTSGWDSSDELDERGELGLDDSDDYLSDLDAKVRRQESSARSAAVSPISPRIGIIVRHRRKSGRSSTLSRRMRHSCTKQQIDSTILENVEDHISMNKTPEVQSTPDPERTLVAPINGESESVGLHPRTKVSGMSFEVPATKQTTRKRRPSKGMNSSKNSRCGAYGSLYDIAVRSGCQVHEPLHVSKSDMNLKQETLELKRKMIAARGGHYYIAICSGLTQEELRSKNAYTVFTKPSRLPNWEDNGMVLLEEYSDSRCGASGSLYIAVRSGMRFTPVGSLLYLSERTRFRF